MNDGNDNRHGVGGDAGGGDECEPGEELGAMASVFVAEFVGALRDSHGTSEGLSLHAYREATAAEARAAVERYYALNLASLGEVLRAHWQAAFEAKVLELARSAVDLQLAERVARESANLAAAKALRGLAGDVVREHLPAFLLVGASEAIRVQGEVVSGALAGFPLQVSVASRPELWAWFARCAAGESGLDRDGRPCDDESSRWLSAVRVRADWPGEEPAARPAWPWGEYTTPALKLVAAAVREFWVEWDGETASAPKNDRVSAWLQERGMSENRAEVVAALIRSPKVPGGARPRRDE